MKYMKLFAYVFLLILLVGTASALTDKSFNKNIGSYGKIELSSRSWIDLFGWFSTPIEDIELKENTFSCITNCEAIKEITLYQNGKLVDDVRFMNLAKTKEVSINSYKFYVQTGTTEKTIDDYENKCVKGNLNINGSYEQSCSNVKVGSHIVNEPIWKEYNYEEVKAGTYTLKLKGIKDASQSVDWQIMSQGKWITDWATWTDALNVNLKAYWNFNDGVGTILNNTYNVAVNNGTLQNIPASAWVTGLLGKALIFNGTNQWVGNISKPTNVTDVSKNYTISLWFKTTEKIYEELMSQYTSGTGGGEYMIAKHSDGSGKIMFLRKDDGFVASTHSVYSTSIISTSSWNHIVVQSYSNGTLKLYFNGTLEDEISDAGGGGVDTDMGMLIGRVANVGANELYFNGTIDEIGVWGRILTPSEISDLYNNGNGITYVLTTGGIPTVTLDSPADNLGTTLTTLIFDSRVTISSGNITNATLKLWNSTGDLYKTNFTTTLGGISNFTNLSLSNIAILLNYTWNVEYCANNRTIEVYNCTSAPANRTFNLLSAQENSWIYNTKSFETERELFNLSLGVTTGVISSSSLIYNGTTYSEATIKNSTATNYTLVKSIDIPLNSGNKSFYFSYIVNGTTYYSTTQYQYVNLTYFVNCNSTIATKFLNVSFKDEVSLAYINATIPTSTFVYYLGSGLVNKTLSFSNNTENPSYIFCGTPNNRTINTDLTMQYKYGTTYPQRIWNPSTLALTNVTTTKILYLLSSSDGIYVTFNVVNSGGQSLEGVTVNGTRAIDGSTEMVADGTTDDSGSVTFWLNPDYSHIFTFSKIGYTTFTTTITPTQSSYTVTFGQTVTSNFTDYSRGIIETIRPYDEFLINDTVYNFNYTINSSYWTLDSFGMVLKYSNNSVIGANSSTSGTGGTVSLFANTLNSTGIIMDYYYIVDGNIVNRTSRFWGIDTTEGREFSIYNFFTDLDLYISANMFGILGNDNGQFNKSLLAFLVIVLTVGTISYRYGITSEVSVMGILLGTVIILNVLPIKLLNSPFFFEHIELGTVLMVVTALLFGYSLWSAER